MDQLTLCIEVSINNPSCVGDRLQSQLIWAAQRFGRVQLSVGDTLNRHNYVALGHPIHGSISPTEAEHVSRQEGEDWMLRHSGMINGVLGHTHVEIVRWDDWLGHSSFPEAMKFVEAEFASNQPLRTAIIADVQGFLARRKAAQPITAEMEQLLNLHLLEEAAVYHIQQSEQRTMLLYPGSMGEAWRYLIVDGGPPSGLSQMHYRYVELRDPKS